MSDYAEFINRKLHVGAEHGFEPSWMPESLFPFQRSITDDGADLFSGQELTPPPESD